MLTNHASDKGTAEGLTRPACLICGGSTTRQFSKTFLANEVGYFRCSSCGHLTATGATEQAYDLEAYFDEIDLGWRERNQRVLEFIRLLTRLPGVALPPNSMVLDYGCGAGLLVGELNGAGFDAYGYEPFQRTADASRRILTDWRDTQEIKQRAKLVTCIEVLEHIRNPDDLLRAISDLLVSNGYLLISTETYKIQMHGHDWYYLNPAAGHVSIYTTKSLLSLMSRHGFVPILRINDLVWLFRLVNRRTRTWLESVYLFASQSRIKLGIRLRF